MVSLAELGLDGLISHTYNYDHGPVGPEGPFTRHEQWSINCQFLTIILAQELLLPLPPQIRSAELFTCRYRGKQYVELINPGGPFRLGDIFLFGPVGLKVTRNFQDRKKLHQAIVINPEPLTLVHFSRWDKSGHLTKPNQAMAEWSLADFTNLPQYQICYGVRRVLPSSQIGRRVNN